MAVIAVIPARYASTRFPGKPLANLCGKPLVVHAAERAREARRVHDVLVATDDMRIFQAVENHGIRAVLTSPDCPSGSDRIAEVAAKMPEAELIVNLQGDEPLLQGSVIDRAVAALEGHPETDVSTAMIRIEKEADFFSPHVVKVVCDPLGRALYFSRSPIPNLTRAADHEKSAYGAQFGENASRKSETENPCPFFGYKHFGLYVYRREALLRFVRLQPGTLEQIEKLEQLRFLENKMEIRVIETDQDSIGVDTPEDLEEARRIISRQQGCS